MRPLRHQPALGRDTLQRREAARSVIAGAASWALLAIADDTAQAPGAAVSTWHARVGTSPTAAGAARPAADGLAHVYAGAQKMDAESGMLGGASGATVAMSIDATKPTNGVVAAYGFPYYVQRRLVITVPSALHVGAAHGETGIGDRNNEFFPVPAHARGICMTADRTQVGAAEFACYSTAGALEADSATTNDTTSTYQTGQATTIGAYGDGTVGVTMRLRALGITRSPATPNDALRLARLIADATGAA